MEPLRAGPRLSSSRSTRLRRNVAALLGARGLTIAMALAQVAVALPYLGGERYGSWMLLLAVASAIHICDFGIGLATQRAMADAIARDHPDVARAVARHGTVALAGIACVLLAAGGPFVAFANWPEWCGLAEASEARVAAGALLVLTALALPLNMAPRVAGAAQRQWIQALWGAVGGAATLAWVVFAAGAAWSFPILVAGAAVIAILQNAAMAIHALRLLGWPLRPWPSLPCAERRELRRNCLLFAVPQFGEALINGMPAAALSVAAGPVAVTGYNLVQRILSPFGQVQGLMLAALWPAYTEAHLRGDLAWVGAKFRQTLGISLGLVVAMAVVTSVIDPLVAWWTRRTFDGLPPALAWAAFGWFGALVAIQPLTSLLIGFGQAKLLARSTAVGYPLAALALIAGALASSPGGALALGAAALGLVLLPLLVVQSRRLLLPAR